MPARHFTAASTEFITLGLGGLGGVAFGPGTCAFVCRPAVVNAAQVIWSAGASGTVGYRLQITSGALLDLICNSNGSLSTTTMAANKWYCVAATKATGSAAARLHIYDYVTDTWTHENGAAINDSSAPLTRAQFGTTQTNTAPFNGDIAVGGVWNIVLTDAQIESLAYDLLSWFAPAQPKGFWLLDQDAVAQKVIDQSGGGANQSGITGTTLSTSSVPVFTRGDAPQRVLSVGTSATTFFGVSDVALTFTATTAGTLIVRTASTFALTLTATTAAVPKKFAVSTAALVFTATTAGRPTKFSNSIAAFTFNATTAGTRTRFGATTAALTFSATSAGKLTAKTSSTAAFTFTATTAGTRKTFGASSTALVFGATDTGKVGAFSSSTVPIVFNATTAAQGHAFGASTAAFVWTATTAGHAGRFGSSSMVETLSITTTGRLAHFGVSTAPFVLTITDAGAVTGHAHFGSDTAAFIMTITSSGTVNFVFPQGTAGEITDGITGIITEPGYGSITEPTEGDFA